MEYITFDERAVSAALVIQRAYRRRLDQKQQFDKYSSWIKVTEQFRDLYGISLPPDSNPPEIFALQRRGTFGSLSEDNRSLFELLGCSEINKFPLLLFRRVSQPQRRWKAGGELGHDADRSWVPRYISSLFRQSQGHEKIPKDIDLAVNLGILRIRLQNGCPHLLATQDFKDYIRQNMTSEQILIRRFDMICLIIQAFPDEYSEIAWEEVRLQLIETVKTACLPLLRVISIEDIKKYIIAKKWQRVTTIAFYSRLLGFLRTMLTSNHYLRYLIYEVLQFGIDLQGDDNFQSELNLARLVLFLHDLDFGQEVIARTWPEKLEYLRSADYLKSRRSNAVLGIALGTYLSSNSITNSLEAARENWGPLQANESSLEKIAKAYLSPNVFHTAATAADSSLEIQTLIGFVFSKRKLFLIAKSVLNAVLLDIENRFGISSLEHTITVAEFAKCCNMTKDEAVGEQATRRSLSKEREIEYQPGVVYLKFALVDSLLAGSNYVSALEVLNDVILDEEVNASNMAKATIRLSKAQRRLDCDYPSALTTTNLIRGLQNLEQIPNDLQSAFTEEVFCHAICFNPEISCCREALTLFETLQRRNHWVHQYPASVRQWDEELRKTKSQVITALQHLQTSDLGQNPDVTTNVSTSSKSLQAISTKDSTTKSERSIFNAGFESPRLPTANDFKHLLQYMKCTIWPQVKRGSPASIIVILLDDASNSSLGTFIKSNHVAPASTCVILCDIMKLNGNRGHPLLLNGNPEQWFLDEIILKILVSNCCFGFENIALIGIGEAGSMVLGVGLLAPERLSGIIISHCTSRSPAPRTETVLNSTPVLFAPGISGLNAEFSSREMVEELKKRFVHVDVEGLLDYRPNSSRTIDPNIGTIAREFIANCLLHNEWIKPAILTLDGGGVRSYGSLLILQELMDKIGAEERRENASTESSFYPCAYKPWSKYASRQQRAGSQAIVSSDSVPEMTPIPVATPTAGLPDSSLFLPCHYFQYVGGTSTGGLISIMISRLRMTVDDCIEEYKTLAADVFGKPRPFSSRNLFFEKFNSKRLYDAIQDLTIRHSDASHITTKWPSPEDLSRTTVVAYNAQRISEVPYLLRTFETYPGYGPRRLIQRANRPTTQDVRNHGPPQDMSIPQVGRATTAAPGYFEHLTVKLGETTLRFKDGGFGCNNPSWEIYRDVLALLVNGSKDMGPFISIGTGISDLKLFPIGEQSGIRRTIATFQAVTKGLPLRTMGTHENMMTAAWRDNKKRFHYSRFDGGPNLATISLDEWKPNDRTLFNTRKHKHSGSETLQKIEDAVRVYLSQKAVQEELDECAKILVRRRRLQIRDESRWDRFACASWYICPYNRCPKQRHDTLEEFKSHVQRHHSRRASEEEFDAKLQLARRCWLYNPRNENVAHNGLNEDSKDDPEEPAETAVIPPTT